MARRLSELSRLGFLNDHENRSRGFRYQSATVELRQQMDVLAILYSEKRISVINLIYSSSAKKIQTELPA